MYPYGYLVYLFYIKLGIQTDRNLASRDSFSLSLGILNVKDVPVKYLREKPNSNCRSYKILKNKVPSKTQLARVTPSQNELEGISDF